MRYTFDSREVKPGMGFVALKGEKVDGREFIPMARERGAAEIVDAVAAAGAPSPREAVRSLYSFEAFSTRALELFREAST